MNRRRRIYAGEDEKVDRFLTNLAYCHKHKERQKELAPADDQVYCPTCKWLDARRRICRRLPPQIVGERVETAWPVVGDNDFCGMHEVDGSTEISVLPVGDDQPCIPGRFRVEFWEAMHAMAQEYLENPSE